MKKIFAFFLFSLPVFAQPTLSRCFIEELGDVYVNIVCSRTPTPNTEFGIKFSIAPDESLQGSTRFLNTEDSNSQWYSKITHLPPDTDIFIVGVSKSGATYGSNFLCTNTCTNCGSGDNSYFRDNSGWDCDAIGEPPRVHTLTEKVCAGGPPCKPENSPVHNAPSTRPTITGSTRNVDAGCTNFQSQMNAAATDARNGSTTELVQIPIGTTCRPELEGRGDYDLPDACPGRLVIDSDADPKLLPVERARIDPSFKFATAKIKKNFTNLFDLYQSTFGDSLASSCIYLNNVSISVPDFSEIPQIVYDVTNITSNGTFTVASTAGLGSTNRGSIVVVDLTGTGMSGGHGPFFACSVTATTFRIKAATNNTITPGFCASQGTFLTLNGSYIGGGKVHRWIAKPIIGISDTTPIQLTITNHGLGNYPSMSISSGTGSTLTVVGTPANFQIQNGYPVKVTGTGNPSCDGIWNVTNRTASGFNVSGATCNSVTTGLVRPLRAITISGTGNQYLGGAFGKVWYPERVDDNNIVLLNSVAQGTIAAAGHLTLEPDRLGATIDDTLNDVTFNHLIIDYPFPWRAGTLFNVSGTDELRIQNSFSRAFSWIRRDPISNNGYFDIGNSTLAHNFMYFLGTNGVISKNNNHYGQPQYFVDTSVNSTTNHSLLQNTFTQPDHLEGNGHYHRVGFCAEYKGLNIGEIKGNEFYGCKADFNLNGPTIGLTPTGSNIFDGFTDGIQDVEFAYNVIRNSGGGLMFSNNDTYPTRKRHITKRVWIHDNIFRDFELSKQGSGGGNCFWLWEPLVDIIIENNTCHTNAAISSNAIYCSDRGSRVAYRNNIIYAHQGGLSPQTMGGVFQGIGSSGANEQFPTPSIAGGLGAFNECFMQGFVPDPRSSFTGNIIIPGIKNSLSGDPIAKATSTGASDTFCKDQATASAPHNGLSANNTYVGVSGDPCNESANQRLNSVFNTSNWRPQSSYVGKGADVDLVNAELGITSNIDVRKTADSIIFSWRAPDTVGCTVDISTDQDFTVAGNITRQTASSGARDQSTTFSSLASSTLYYYRLMCLRINRGEVTTQ